MKNKIISMKVFRGHIMSGHIGVFHFFDDNDEGYGVHYFCGCELTSSTMLFFHEQYPYEITQYFGY